jgi:flagellin-like protein
VPLSPRTGDSLREADRGASPVVAVVLLVGVTVVCAASVGGLLFGQAAALGEPPPQVALSLSVTDDRISISHRTGESLDASKLRLHVVVNGTPLAHQPPVPFFSARGFAPGPTGPFNSASDPEWNVGEVASFEVAGTNRPALGVGETVTVEVSQGETLVASLEATVEAEEG